MLPFTGIKLIDLIPQKLPFVLIGALIAVDEKRCTTTFTFNNNHVLCSNGFLTVAGLIENIAQTCAAKMGYECYLANKPVPLGFIGDVKDFAYTRLPGVNEQITTHINIDNEIFDVTIITGKVYVQDELIASCKMKIFVEPEKKGKPVTAEPKEG